MRVGLMGFGKTGKAVATVLLESKTTNLQWVVRQSKRLEHRSVPEYLGVESEEPGLIYSSDEFSANELLDQYPVDAIVDFSSANGHRYYLEAAAKRKVTVISAVSQYDQETIIRLRKFSRQTRVVHSPNITLGINFLLIAARILKNIAPQTDIEVIEEHFKLKPEVSGTAKVIARHLGIEEESIKTIRAGGIIGTHEILFGFPYQTVRLKHESIAREAFGNGILFAVNNLPSRKTGFYTLEDLMLPYFDLKRTESEFEAANKSPWWKLW